MKKTTFIEKNERIDEPTIKPSPQKRELPLQEGIPTKHNSAYAITY